MVAECLSFSLNNARTKSNRSPNALYANRVD